MPERTDMTEPVGTFHARSEEFHLSEYACLRSEIELVLKDYRELERNIVIAVGVTWAWLYHEKMAAWAFCIPCVFAILGALRAKGVNSAFGVLHKYILKLESAFHRQGGPQGWEHEHLQTGFAKGSGAFWLILIVVTIAVAIFVFYHPLNSAIKPL